MTQLQPGAREDFLARLHRNAGYGKLIEAPAFDRARQHRFDEFCWKEHQIAVRNELIGARAKRVLSSLRKLRAQLGAAVWLEQWVLDALDQLDRELEKLASKARRGRPKDNTAQVFREISYNLLPFQFSRSPKSRRALKRDDADEHLAKVFAVIFGRAIAPESFTRMRKRGNR